MNYRGLNIPFVSFGNVTSDDLFCDKEQAIFDFYEAAGKAKRYTRALDIGANIGVHSILMARQGWDVRAFEPDPQHAEAFLWQHRLRNDVPLGGFPRLEIAAVSDKRGALAGSALYVRVYGNTTGNHLKGDKQPYGDIEEFEVPVVDCRPLFDWADFAKIDCEGHEARLLLTVKPDQQCEFMVEIGNQANAKAIYGHFHGWRGMWAQKTGWKPEIPFKKTMEDLLNYWRERV